MNSPFNEQKYKGLLEGLEVSEHNYSEIVKDIFRLDSEPFQKTNQTNFGKFKTKKLSEIAFTNPVKSEISDLDRNLSVSFIPMTMLGNGIINQQETGKISDFTKAGYTYFAENDILIAKITPCMEYGKCAIANGLKNGIGFGSTEYNVFRIKDERFLKEYLFAYLNRDIIRKQAEINMIGTSGRQRVPISFYKNLQIPIVDITFQKKIKQKFDEAHSKRERSQTLYRQAEELLLETIGLKNFTPSEKGISVKSFKESFLETGRLDAEYYQPKYEKIIDIVKNYQNGFANLESFIDSYSTGYPYKSETYITENGIPLVRINNLTKEGLDLSNVIHIPKEDLNLSKKDIAQENDILISMSGTIGLSCIVREKSEIVINQRIMKITSKNYNPQVLSMLLNSIVGKYQLERIGTGGVQTNISSNDIKSIIIPIIDLPTQQQISDLIQESFNLREESGKLLQEAEKVLKNI